MNTKKAIITVLAAGILVTGVASVGAQTVNPNAPVAEQIQRGERGGFDGELMTLVESYTGLSGQELRDALQGGSTVTDLITTNGGDVSAFISEAVTAATASIDEKVASGEMTQERADELKAELEIRITERINGTQPVREGRGNRGDRQAFDGELSALVESYTGLSGEELATTVRDGSTLAELIAANGGDVEVFIAEAMTITGAEDDARVRAFVNGERPQRGGRGGNAPDTNVDA